MRQLTILAYEAASVQLILHLHPRSPHTRDDKTVVVLCDLRFIGVLNSSVSAATSSKNSWACAYGKSLSITFHIFRSLRCTVPADMDDRRSKIDGLCETGSPFLKYDDDSFSIRRSLFRQRRNNTVSSDSFLPDARSILRAVCKGPVAMHSKLGKDALTSGLPNVDKVSENIILTLPACDSLSI